MIKSRDLMYQNRDIVNGSEASNEKVFLMNIY